LVIHHVWLKPPQLARIKQAVRSVEKVDNRGSSNRGIDVDQQVGVVEVPGKASLWVSPAHAYEVDLLKEDGRVLGDQIRS